MPATHYVYSNLANDNAYATYMRGGDGEPLETHRIVIAGKAGLADKTLVTALGAVTPVSEEELAVLQQNSEFLAHQKRGHIRVTTINTPIEKVVADMGPRDPSAPKQPGDFVGKDGKALAVKTGGKDKH